MDILTAAKNLLSKLDSSGVANIYIGRHNKPIGTSGLGEAILDLESAIKSESDGLNECGKHYVIRNQSSLTVNE